MRWAFWWSNKVKGCTWFLKKQLFLQTLTLNKIYFLLSLCVPNGLQTGTVLLWETGDLTEFLQYASCCWTDLFFFYFFCALKSGMRYGQLGSELDTSSSLLSNPIEQNNIQCTLAHVERITTLKWTLQWTAIWSFGDLCPSWCMWLSLSLDTHMKTGYRAALEVHKTELTEFFF